MATTTTNFGWDIPQSTDLVKDGATAIAALGQDIDTALIDLKGGTTGQVLTKASNTDLDFSFTTPAAPSGSGLTLIKRSTFSAVANTGTTFDTVFSSTYKSYLVVIEDIFAATGTDDLHFQFRAGGVTTTSGYYANYYGYQLSTSLQSAFSNNTTQMTIAKDTGSSGGGVGSGVFTMYGVGNTTAAAITGQYYTRSLAESGTIAGSCAGTNFDGFLLKSASTNITGTVAVYGLAAA